MQKQTHKKIPYGFILCKQFQAVLEALTFQNFVQPPYKWKVIVCAGALTSLAFRKRPGSLVQTTSSDCSHKERMCLHFHHLQKRNYWVLIPHYGSNETSQVNSALSWNTVLIKPLHSTKSERGPPFHIQLNPDFSILPLGFSNLTLSSIVHSCR